MITTVNFEIFKISRNPPYNFIWLSFFLKWTSWFLALKLDFFVEKHQNQIKGDFRGIPG